MASEPPEMLEYRVVEEDGLWQELYLKDDKCHRRDGPAAIVRDLNGNLLAEFWCCEGALHREGAPAAIYFDPDSGAVEEELYCRDGRLWREDGPAEIRYRVAGGGVAAAAWWRDGEKLPLTLTRWLWLTEPGRRSGQD